MIPALSPIVCPATSQYSNAFSVYSWMEKIMKLMLLDAVGLVISFKTILSLLQAGTWYL